MKFQVNKCWFCVKQIIADVEEIMEIKLQSKGNIFLADLERYAFDNIFSDDKRIKQILLNLISNALKFTCNGTITIKVRTLDKTHLPEYIGCFP